MFSPDRYGARRGSFGIVENSGRNFVGLKTAFRNKETRTPLQKAAHFRFSEPATPSVLKDRGLRPSDLSDPHKKQFLTELTGRIFHLAVSGVEHGEEGDKKISLERLFTPATDSGDLTPRKSMSKKAFASSSFYRPDHPTIDDQVELAQRISFSLVDENNKMSRGQSMYMKRKKRSMRWIHEGGGSGTEMTEDESAPRTPTARRPASMPPLNDADAKKPAMKLLMNPKGVQDFHAVQEHYQALLNAAPPSPEVGKIVSEPVESPTGKGAELFAKRKKRMDQFIVDETTVQKAQQQTTTMTQQQSVSSTSNFSSSATTTTGFGTKKQAELERNKQQQEVMLANTVCERADTKVSAAPWLDMPKPVPVNAPPLAGLAPTPAGPLAPGPSNLPDLTKILTQPTKSEPSKSKVEPLKSKPVPSKSKPWPPITPQGVGGGPVQPSAAGRVRALASPPVRSPLPTPPIFASSPKPLTKVFPPLCSSTSLSHVSKTATISVRDQTISQCRTNVDSCSHKPAENAKSSALRHSSAVVATKAVASPGLCPSVAFPKPDKVSSNLQESADSQPKAFPPVVSKFKPVKLDLGSSEVARVSPKPISYLSYSAPATAEVPGPSSSAAAAASLVLSGATTLVSAGTTASVPSALDFETCPRRVPSAAPGPTPATATAPATLVQPASLPAPRPSTFPTDGTSSSSIVDAGPRELKPGTPPLYVFPDGTEAADLNNDTTKSRDETSTEPLVQQLASGKGVGKLDDSCRATACQPLPTDGAAASDLQAVNPEVSNSCIVTACSSSSNNTSNSNVINTSSNSRMSKINSSINNSTSKINCTSSNYNSNRPARPTSLPLIPLSSLVNSVIPCSPSPPASASVLPVPPRSPPACNAATNARSLSSFSVVQTPEPSSAASPLVCAEDVGSKRGILDGHGPGSSEATTTSPTFPLPDSSTYPPETLRVSLDFTSSDLQPSQRISQLSDTSNSQHVTLKTQSFLSAHPELTQVSQTTSGVYKSITSINANLQEGEIKGCQDSILTTPFSTVNSTSEIISSKKSVLEVINEDIIEELDQNVDLHSKSHSSKQNNLRSVSPSLQKNITLDNISQEVPDIQIYEEQRKPSVEEDELRKFLSEIEHTFENLPSAINTISVEDLKPPDFYRSVSRTSLNLELEDNEPLIINGVVLEGFDTGTEAQDHQPDDSEDVPLHHSQFVPEGDSEELCMSCNDLKKDDVLRFPSRDETPCLVNIARENKELVQAFSPVSPSIRNNSPLVMKSKEVGNHKEVEYGELVHAIEKVKTESKLEEESREVESEEAMEGVDEDEGELGKLRERMLFTEMSSVPTNPLPPPLSPPSHATNPAAPSTGTGAIYTAEVKVVQRASHPPTPVVDVSQHTLMDFSSDQSDKRRSASFNLAAKGWGTYNNFYTPVTFAT